jgi:hypothetical protein
MFALCGWHWIFEWIIPLGTRKIIYEGGSEGAYKFCYSICRTRWNFEFCSMRQRSLVFAVVLFEAYARKEHSYGKLFSLGSPRSCTPCVDTQSVLVFSVMVRFSSGTVPGHSTAQQTRTWLHIFYWETLDHRLCSPDWHQSAFVCVPPWSCTWQDIKCTCYHHVAGTTGTYVKKFDWLCSMRNSLCWENKINWLVLRHVVDIITEFCCCWFVTDVAFIFLCLNGYATCKS